MPVLTAISLPEGIYDEEIKRQLLTRYGIEIGGGFGALKGRLLRIGLMGYNSNRKNVNLVLEALEHTLLDCGFRLTPGASRAAVEAVYAENGA